MRFWTETRQIKKSPTIEVCKYRSRWLLTATINCFVPTKDRLYLKSSTSEAFCVERVFKINSPNLWWLTSQNMSHCLRSEWIWGKTGMTSQYIGIDLKGWLLLLFYRLLRALSQKYLLIFLSNVYISPWLWKIFKFTVFSTWKNICQSHICHAPSGVTMPPGWNHHHQAQGYYSSPKQYFFWKYICPGKGERNTIPIPTQIMT